MSAWECTNFLNFFWKSIGKLDKHESVSRVFLHFDLI